MRRQLQSNLFWYAADKGSAWIMDR